MLKSLVTPNINKPVYNTVEATVRPKNSNKFSAPLSKALIDTQTLRIGTNDKYHWSKPNNEGAMPNSIKTIIIGDK